MRNTPVTALGVMFVDYSTFSPQANVHGKPKYNQKIVWEHLIRERGITDDHAGWCVLDLPSCGTLLSPKLSMGHCVLALLPDSFLPLA